MKLELVKEVTISNEIYYKVMRDGTNVGCFLVAGEQAKEWEPGKTFAQLKAEQLYEKIKTAPDPYITVLKSEEINHSNL